MTKGERQLSAYELRDLIPRARELVEPGKSTIVKVPEMQVVKVVEDDRKVLEDLYELPYGTGYLAVFTSGAVAVHNDDDYLDWEGRHGVGTKLELIDEYLAAHPRLAERWAEIYERLRHAAEAEGRIPTDPMLRADVETNGELTGTRDGRLSVLYNTEREAVVIERFRADGGKAIEKELEDEFRLAFTW